MKKSSLVIIIFAIVSLFYAFGQHRWVRNEILKYDGSGYYVYLPAVLIYNDLGEMKFYKHIDSVYHPSNEYNYYSLFKNDETQLYTNKYAIGVSVGEMPLFLIAHWYTRYLDSDYPIDGYASPYEFSVAMSSILWVVIGMFFLSAFLRNYYSDGVTALTLLILGFGTNLYCYTLREFGMSHGLAFMIFSAILYFTQRWYLLFKPKDAIFLGLFLGWTIITRPIDIMVILIPLLWQMM
ncbi:MAG: hypothetical protein IT256_04410 [Chitinophagaceae bacterium]|nr:hypothetical protein [Chitinophagaceae bacterium]